jgi:hypothetical protein
MATQIIQYAYKHAEDIPKFILIIATIYEGYIKNRIGYNIPVDFIRKLDKKHIVFQDEELKQILKNKNILYIVVYRKNDYKTRDHELAHAKFHINSQYRNNIIQKWEALEKKEQIRIINKLLLLGYPNDNNILIDEWQAYLTEDLNYFKT